MTACKSAGPNELIRPSVVGLAEGEGDETADGLADATGLPRGVTIGGGVCANAFIAVKRLMKDNEVN
jgi:hypothetical protein